VTARTFPAPARVLRRPASAAAPAGMPVLLVSAPFGARLDGAAVARAVSRGLRAGGLAAPEVLELPDAEPDAAALRELLERERFDARLHLACALLIVVAGLCERTLARSPAFELASRARQGGVPAYAIARESSLGAFDERILDLQLVLRAGSARGLADAGARFAGLLLAGPDARGRYRGLSADSTDTRR